ncbi:MAG: ATP phosphoribosyltransferase regulatory subunit [Thiovulaceae bacterium]|nr:ATP phosphoribosyltransferase regulatory subunit [Sulfurimonadaceae bacterium]
MVFEHEIPEGSKLYFGENAKLKREIENKASDVLMNEGFEEIITPVFSYHQHLSIEDEREVVRVNDTENNHMTLRADSTIDVVRIVDKRLGRNTKQKKWFYIQPVLRYPSTEIYQIGAEVIDEGELSSVLSVAIKTFKALETQPLLQLSNINIPKILVEEFDFELDSFKRIEVQTLRAKGYGWMDDLIYLNKAEQITEELLEKVPEAIREELLKLKTLALEVAYENVVVAPLYYAKMRYYDELFFRFIEKNDVLSRGGRYKSDGICSVGFALYTDELIELIDKKRRG